MQSKKDDAHGLVAVRRNLFIYSKLTFKVNLLLNLSNLDTVLRYLTTYMPAFPVEILQ